MWHQDLAQWQNMSWRDHRQAAAKGRRSRPDGCLPIPAIN
ncbi:hypothetical protein [Escherichia coli ISC41]|nr:hypothetical protein [Escherichia coli ISC41]